MAGTVTCDAIKTGTGVVILRPIQQVLTTSATLATGTTTIPFDNTIPQITEGDQYMTATIVPTNSTSLLVIEALVVGAHSFAGVASINVALFQDATANALAVVSTVSPAAGSTMSIPLHFRMTAGATASTTFRIRAGANGAGTFSFNGSAGAQIFGGVCGSFLKVTEYLQQG